MKLDFTMQDARFGALIAFAAVSDEKSFTRAARRLHVSPSAVSQAVRRLEAKVGVPLLVRTSRHVALTDAGRKLLARAVPALASLASTFADTEQEAGAVTGTLRITCPTLAAALLPPIVERYLANNPSSQIDASINDRVVDLVADRYDIGVRLEETLPAEMIRLRIADPFRFVVVASPGYLAAHGTPRTFDDLSRHTCIDIRFPTTSAPYRWELVRRGRIVRPERTSRIVVDGMRFGVELARAGLGLAYIDEPWVADDLARGVLRIVVPQLAARATGLFAFYPEASARSPRVRAFADAVREVRRAKRTAP